MVRFVPRGSKRSFVSFAQSMPTTSAACAMPPARSSLCHVPVGMSLCQPHEVQPRPRALLAEMAFAITLLRICQGKPSARIAGGLCEVCTS